MFCKRYLESCFSDKLSCGLMVNLPAWLCDSINSKKPHYENNYIQPNEKIGYVKNGKFIEEIPNKFDDSSNSSSFCFAMFGLLIKIKLTVISGYAGYHSKLC